MKRPVLIGLTAALVMIAAGVATLVSTDAPPAPLVAGPRPPVLAPQAVVTAPLPAVVTVLSVQGLAERERSGVWSPLREGDALLEHETLRTSAEGGVELQLGDAQSRITVASGTTVQVRELSAEIHRLGLTRGRLTVDYEERGTRALRIEGGAGAVATTRGARFTVLSSGTTVAVATQRGEVGLSNEGRTVAVPAGSQSVALAQTAPSAATLIPLDVLLEVARAAAGDRLCARVKGSVRPGAEVTVAGVDAPVDASGRFALDVAQAPGLKEVLVVAVEPSGRRREERIACRSPSSGSVRKLEIDWQTH